MNNQDFDAANQQITDQQTVALVDSMEADVLAGHPATSLYYRLLTSRILAKARLARVVPSTAVL